MTEYAELAYTDDHGDDLQVGLWEDGTAIMQTVDGDRSMEVLLDRGKVLDLYHRLGDHLVATRPDFTEAPRVPPATVLPCATADGYDWPTAPTCCTGEDDSACCPTEVPFERVPFHHRDESSVLSEAQAAVYGDRQADYGHPREDFTRQAILFTGLLQHKLADGAYVEAEDVARLMVAVKLARDVHSPKRDNRVDGAGYFLTLDRLATGQ